MQAVIQPSYDTNRQMLAEVIPLSAPYTIYIEPTKACNFKCYYCMHSTRDQPNGAFHQMGFSQAHIEDDFFKKIAREIMAFEPIPKRIVFSGLGDPLCNPKLADMVKYLRDIGFIGRIDIITNGVLLPHEVADALTDAGVSRIQISIQGIHQDGYLENCGVKLDFDRFVEQLQYLYQHRKNTEIFIKIIDALLEDEEMTKQFYNIFGDLCNTIYIEHLIVLEQQMGDHGGKVDASRNLNNETFKPHEICPVGFYHLQISREGWTFPCPVPGLPMKFSLGDAKTQSLQEIWQGNKRDSFLKAQLKLQRHHLSICKTCTACAAVADPKENLDPVADELLNRWEAWKCNLKSNQSQA